MRPRIVVLAAGLLFAIAWAALMQSFPILTGSDLQARLHGAALTALGFPFVWAARPLLPVPGIEPVVVVVCLVFLDGALWGALFLAIQRAARRRASLGMSATPPAP